MATEGRARGTTAAPLPQQQQSPQPAVSAATTAGSPKQIPLTTVPKSISPVLITSISTISGVPQHRPRAPSLIPNLIPQVEIVKQGWLNKQGGAKGGRKSWSVIYNYN